MVGWVIFILLLPALAVLASLSPLLTLAWLWQIKEWRIDRLLEHLRREGIFLQVWGRIRPGVVALFAVATVITWSAEDAIVLLTIATLLLLALLTVVQMIMRLQHYPVLTQKALAITVTAILLTIATTAVMVALLPLTLPAVALLQPLMLALSWLLWHPVDAFLKSRIIARAKAARERHPDLTVIGVTGSVGKTTTKELLACVLKDLNPLVTPTHVNSEIGVAQWLTSKLASAPAPVPVIVEMGAYRKGEIALMSTYVQQTMAVVTHVGTQHIALFGSQQMLFDAKSELVTSLSATGHAFLNGDNELTRKMKEQSPCPVTIVGTGGQCDLEAFDIEEMSTGIRFRARGTVYDVPLQGTHNVTNILLSIAVGEALGVKAERMRELLKTFTPLSGTFNVRTEAGVRILDDTHNSSAASVKAAIAWARNQQEKYKTLLAAGLIEMGEFQSPAEQELGALAGNVFERIIVIDSQSAMNFRSGGAVKTEKYSKTTEKIPAGSLLVCSGRMAQSSIQKLLP